MMSGSNTIFRITHGRCVAGKPDCKASKRWEHAVALFSEMPYKKVQPDIVPEMHSGFLLISSFLLPAEAC